MFDRLSAPTRLTRLTGDANMDVAIAVDRNRIAGMNDDSGAGILDDRGPREAHARLELFAVVDRGFVHALQRVIDGAAPLERGRRLGAARLALAHRELAHFGGGDEMDADHFDRR